MKKIFIALGVFFLIVACAQGNEMILEFKDVQFFEMTEVTLSDKTLLKISGLAFHSSLATGEVETKLESGSLTIFIHLVPANKGMSGNFSYEVSVPDIVNVVRFGNEAAVIWKRKPAPID